jgi:hypothetical protein
MYATGFWIAIAAVVVAVIWTRSRSEQLKHETIRQIIDKTGQIDEEQLRKLFQYRDEGRIDVWAHLPDPGFGYRALRILGVLTLFAAAGLAAFAGIMIGGSQLHEDFEEFRRFADDLWPAFPSAIALAIFGCGIFYCSRFLPRPSANGSARNDRN